jgi:hypothetical protein
MVALIGPVQAPLAPAEFNATTPEIIVKPRSITNLNRRSTQLYTDRNSVERCLACEADSGRRRRNDPAAIEQNSGNKTKDELPLIRVSMREWFSTNPSR